MTRDELIETMARAGIRADIKTDEHARCVATFMASAIEAAGLAIVPVKPSAAQLDCVCSDVEPWTDNIMTSVYSDMIEAGRI